VSIREQYEDVVRVYDLIRMCVVCLIKKRGGGGSSVSPLKYVSMRQHTSAYVRMRQHTSAGGGSSVSPLKYVLKYVTLGGGSSVSPSVLKYVTLGTKVSNCRY
jgi:hypothetical protein